MPTPDLIPEPSLRHLRIFAFDPSLSSQFDTAGIGEITIYIPWERNLTPGPIGEYIEVIDADPASGMFYKPVDLNDPHILAQNGLAPSEANPQFHQQMVYAVAMATIRQFEEALGRVALWSSHEPYQFRKEFVRRLRIYPHALRERNAYYSPTQKALLFGYFPVSIKDASNTPGTLIFTCLSHDIVAHETAHALLDGVHPNFNEPVNADVLAFHEAFADVVALFQHFSFPGILRDQIARTRGNLASENLLGQLAQQFGKASGHGQALRDALGKEDKVTGEWKPHKPDVHRLERTHTPHERGAILVAAIFGAFLKVYRARTADLYRIASEGTGVLREGEISPDLANRLATEAARCALQTLQKCIRALDYCPPVGITFGDYLRAIVTADTDLNPEDTDGYRLAFVESFRNWGIHPEGMRSMSVEGLLWPTGKEAMEEEGKTLDKDEAAIRSLLTKDQDTPQLNATRIKWQSESGWGTGSGSGWGDTEDERSRVPNSGTGSGSGAGSDPNPTKFQPWTLDSDRYAAWQGIGTNNDVLLAWLLYGDGRRWAPAFGIVLQQQAPSTVFRPFSGEGIGVEVHSVRTALRRTPRGSPVTDLVVEMTQSRHGYFDETKQKEMDAFPGPPPEKGDFIYRAGCTVLINSTTMEVRRVIRTPGTILDNVQLARVRRFLTGGGLEPGNAFDFARAAMDTHEPFALLHREAEE